MMRQYYAALALICATSLVLAGTPPAWWTAPATKIIQPGAAENNYAPVNLGQLKYTAYQAKAYLDATLPSGSGTEITAMVAAFKTQALINNYTPVTIGQLKAVAKPFYDRLIAVGYDTRASLVAHGFSGAGIYPWNPATPTAANYDLANLGQLKMAFSFDLTGFSTPTPTPTPAPPVVTVPLNITVTAPGSSGAVVTFTTSAINGARASIPTVNTPASGFTFPVGKTTVTATATDSFGQTTSKTFEVWVNPAGFLNRASGGTVSASSENPPNEAAAKAFDGNTSTKWYSGSATGSLMYQFGGGASWVVTQYTVTSANDNPNRDPKNWQFQGSNDGTTWTTLDTQTNQTFNARYQTKTYPIANSTAYSRYRLNITANVSGSGLQLSEFGLFASPVVNPAGFLNRANGGTASASSENPPNETAVKAFDGTTTTKWFCGSPTGWLAYQFGDGSSWVVTQYTLSSANDSPTRDPKNWQFQGSNDGTTWTTLDTQTNQTFNARFQTNTYPITNSTAYSRYRLNITGNVSGGSIQLSELGLFASLRPPVINSPATAIGYVGTAFSYTITATNAPTSFGATGLPAGLSVNATTGVISGTPSAAGVSNVTLSATNAAGALTQGLTLTVAPDSDTDRLSDAWEMQYFGDLTHSANEDADADGLTNAAEQAAGLDPTNPDGDFDGVGDAQELIADGTDPINANDVAQRRIAYFPMDAANFASAEGQLPRSTTGVTQVPGRKGNAARIDAIGDILNYDWKRSDGSPNYSFKRGSVRLWFKPDWSSAQMSGTWSRLFEVGGPWGYSKAYTMLRLHAAQPIMAVSEADGNGHYLDYETVTPFNWPASTWHQVVFIYSPISRSFYVDGILVGQTSASWTVTPKVADIVAKGLTLGNESTGGQPVYGAIDEVEIFNYELTAADVVQNYNTPPSLDTDGDGMPDDWEEYYFGTGGASPGANGDGDTLTNLQEYLAGTDPTKRDTDDDGIDDGAETTTSATRADSDQDLMPDKWEQIYGLNPSVDNRSEDPDSDGMGRTLEHLSGRSSATADSKTDATDRALDVYSAY